MKELKSLIRKHEMPLQQIVNRYFEKYSNANDNINIKDTNTSKQIFAENPVLQKIHTNGPLIENVRGLQSYNLSFHNIKIKIKKENDCFILTKDKQVVKCLIIANDGEILILGKYFKSVLPFFSEPIDSSKLDIFLVENLSDNIRSWKMSEISKKIMILKNENQLVAMPILHSSI